MEKVYNNYEDLLRDLYSHKMAVVCGYDNVGKGSLIRKFRDDGIAIFYPDYDLICSSASQKTRWTYFMYFLDMYKKLRLSFDVEKLVIFDRSAICGAVYNRDESIAELYKSYVDDIDLIHVLVTCSEYTYNKLQEARCSDTKFSYSQYLEYTEYYKYIFDKYDLSYVCYESKFDKELFDHSRFTCLGCSFNKYGKCVNKLSGRVEVSDEEIRCDYSNNKEVQDLQ